MTLISTIVDLFASVGIATCRHAGSFASELRNTAQMMGLAQLLYSAQSRPSLHLPRGAGAPGYCRPGADLHSIPVGIRLASRGTRTSLALLLGLLAFAVPASAQLLSTTPEFQVNSTTALNQAYPHAARTGTQGFVVVWETEDDIVTSDDVFIRAFDNTGAPRGPQRRANTTTAGAQDTSAVAVDAAGNVMAVWESVGQDASAIAVIGRMFDSDASPVGTEFRLNVYEDLAQDEPTVTAGAPGKFVAAWESTGQDGSQSGIYARMFNTTGVPMSNEFRVNSFTLGSQARPAIASDAAGNFVVVWHSANQDGSAAGVFGQRFNASGAPLGTEFQVNTFTTGPQDETAVAVDGFGNFVVVWESGSATQSQDGSAGGIYGQRFDSAGARLGTEFHVSTYTILNQDDVAVAAAADGSFIVSWESVLQDGSDPGVYAQRYAPTGERAGTEFRVPLTTANSQEDPTVVIDEAGSAVVVWQSDLQDGDLGGIYLRAVCDSTGGDPALGFVCSEPLCNADGVPCLDGMCCNGRCSLQGSCLFAPGDCNSNGLLDAGDPICTILCLIGSAAPGANCQFGADCNCNLLADAGDPICTILRVIDGLATDACIPIP